MMAVSNFGGTPRVFVTGQMDGSAPKTLMATWQYDQNGNVVAGWPQTYAPLPVQKANYGVAVISDGGDGCFVTGAVTKDGEGLNICLIHYHGDGTMYPNYPVLWNNHLQNGDDYPVALSMVNGEVWIAGVSTGAGTGFDIFLIGYRENGAGGIDLLDYERYDGPSNKSDVAVDLATYTVALAGQGGGGGQTGITVVGTSFDDATKNDIVTLNYVYDSSTGLVAYTNPVRYTGNPPNTATNQVATAMATRTNNSVDQDIFICGYTDQTAGTTGLDYLTLAYQSRGEFTWWDRQDNNPAVNGDDVAVRIAVGPTREPSGSTVLVFVTGTSWAGAANLYDVRTYALTRNTGSLAPSWAPPLPNPHVISGTADDRANDLTLLDNGDLYLLTKRSNGLNFDFRTVKINSHTGEDLWLSPPPPIYDAPLGGQDGPAAVRVLSFGDPINPDVFVTGRSQGALENAMKYVTIKYTQP